MNNQPPERIYLQCYESDGSLRDFIHDDVTWCVDQINDNDAVYALVPEHSSTRGKFVYIGRKSCGCAVGVVTDLGDSFTANAVAGFIKEGLTVNRIPWSIYQQVVTEETFMACPHGQIVLPLKPTP